MEDTTSLFVIPVEAQVRPMGGMPAGTAMKIVLTGRDEEGDDKATQSAGGEETAAANKRKEGSENDVWRKQIQVDAARESEVAKRDGSGECARCAKDKSPTD